MIKVLESYIDVLSRLVHISEVRILDKIGASDYMDSYFGRLCIDISNLCLRIIRLSIFRERVYKAFPVCLRLTSVSIH